MTSFYRKGAAVNTAALSWQIQKNHKEVRVEILSILLRVSTSSIFHLLAPHRMAESKTWIGFHWIRFGAQGNLHILGLINLTGAWLHGTRCRYRGQRAGPRPAGCPLSSHKWTT
jgi:hypothetical protein